MQYRTQAGQTRRLHYDAVYKNNHCMMRQSHDYSRGGWANVSRIDKMCERRSLATLMPSIEHGALAKHMHSTANTRLPRAASFLDCVDRGLPKSYFFSVFHLLASFLCSADLRLSECVLLRAPVSVKQRRHADATIV